MAKTIQLDLSQFKASGVYTLEFDASENIIINPSTIRLVIGYSNIGPFNTPVYCPDFTTFKTIFGDIDKPLEKKGSFFHRSVSTCLQSGPVFALNLRILNNSVDENGDPDFAAGADVARYRAFSLDTEEQNGANATGGYSDPLSKQDKLVSSYYNKEKFWFPSTEYLLATEDTSGSQPDSRKLFSIVNLDQSPVSVIVRKSLDSRFPLKGFDITAGEYFGRDNVPSFMNEYDYLSDWFIDVLVLSGNWTDYQALANDPLYSAYFNSKGFIKEKLDDFLALEGVKLITSVTGTIIPNFVDQNGILRYIQTLINNQTPQTGIFCAVNEEALDDLINNSSVIDLVGHHLVDEIGPDADITSAPKNLNFLSYSQNLFADFTYYRNVDGTTGGTAVSDNAVSPGTLDELPETGTLLDDAVLFSASGSGIESTDMASPWTLSGAKILLDTEFTNSTLHDDQILALQEFLDTTPSQPGDKWVLGRVTSSLPTPGYLGFYEGDLVKLRVISSETITNSSLAVGVQTQIRMKLTHPLIGSTLATTYVEPWDETNKNSSSAYQLGNPDYFDNDDFFFSPDIPAGDDSYIGYENSLAYIDYTKGNLGNGDVVWLDDSGSLLQYLKFETNIDRDGYTYLVISAFSDDTFATPESVATWDSSYLSSLPIGTNLASGESFNIISTAGNISDYVDITAQLAANIIELTEAQAESSGIKVGNLLVSTDTQIYDNPVTENLQSRLTRVLEVKRVASPASPGNFTIQVKTERPIKLYPGVTSRVLKFKSVQEFVKTFNLTYLPGAAIKSGSVPNGTDNRMNEILDVLTNTNLGRALQDTDVITFRYIVDTFDGGIQPNCKYQLTRLAKNRQKCMAICNAPSMQKFADSIDPRFTSAPTSTDPAPILQARYIAEGGNLSLNPSFTFSLPGEDLGAKFAGFFAPFLTIRENSKNLNVPPAAYVSNNFIRKFITGEPYSIVAGVKRGIISAGNLVGVEYEFDLQDREFLEPFGINPIIRKRGIGIVIYGNQTSYQRTNSAFNNLHVRDLLITIETAIEEILGNYVFDFNEDSVRLEIKTLVDNYLTGVRSVGGIYNFLTIMDSSNNTPAVIDQNIGIIDVIIEPARGIHKFINRMTVTRTGGIDAGGFTQFA